MSLKHVVLFYIVLHNVFVRNSENNNIEYRIYIGSCSKSFVKMLILKFNLTECCKSLKRALNVGFPLNNFDSCLTQSKIEYLWLMFWPLYL